MSFIYTNIKIASIQRNAIANIDLMLNSTIPKLRLECELRMITDHLDFLHSDCKEMVSQEKRVDLHNMYVLLKPIPDGLKTLIQAFLDHIKNEGIETISTLKGETVSYIADLIDCSHFSCRR